MRHFFPILFGVPAPTLEVVNVGYAVIRLGENKAAFPADEWQLEEGRLVYTQHQDDGTDRRLAQERKNKKLKTMLF